MKKYILCALVIASMLGTNVYAADADVYLNGIKVETGTSPQTKGDKLFVPLRIIAEGIGSQIKWAETKTIITSTSGNEATIVHGSWTAYKNGSPVQLSNSIYTENGVTFVEAGDLGRLLDCKIDYDKTKNAFTLSYAGETKVDQSTSIVTAPKLEIGNDNLEYVSFATILNGKLIKGGTAYQAVCNSTTATKNIYTPSVGETFKFNFGGAIPNSVSVSMEYLTENKVASDMATEKISFVKNGDFYEFSHNPSKNTEELASMIYIIDATWGGSTFKYAFAVNNINTLNSLDALDTKMKALKVDDYCVAGNRVYYITIGGDNTIHRMYVDGREDMLVANFPKSENINSYTTITSQYDGGSIVYELQQTQENPDIDDENLDELEPARFYNLNLMDNSLMKK